MSDFKRLADLLRNAAQALTASRETAAVRVASDLRALVQSRIIQTGTNADGQKFPAYSRKKAPAYLYVGKSRNAGAEARVKKAGSLSYAEFRELNNLQTDHVDLYLTGQMWRNTGVVVERRLLRSTLVRIEGRTSDAAQKIDWNSLRYGGSILEPSQQEIQQARKAYFDDRRNLLRRTFGP